MSVTTERQFGSIVSLYTADSLNSPSFYTRSQSSLILLHFSHIVLSACNQHGQMYFAGPKDEGATRSMTRQVVPFSDDMVLVHFRTYEQS